MSKSRSGQAPPSSDLPASSAAASAVPASAMPASAVPASSVLASEPAASRASAPASISPGSPQDSANSAIHDKISLRMRGTLYHRTSPPAVEAEDL
ncbi:MAG TPA: hypothetical protein ENK57_19990 [Polyangiaceae bacterium]|nr:hypothetical protein [Polyangiaceae bacterium]